MHLPPLGTVFVNDIGYFDSIIPVFQETGKDAVLIASNRDETALVQERLGIVSKGQNQSSAG